MKTKIYAKISTPVLIVLILLGAAMALTQTPALSRNGKIVFTSDRNGKQEIFLMNGDGTQQERLVSSSASDSFPTWSPDGRKIAFVGQNGTGGFSIKLVNAAGTNETEVTPIDFRNSPYPWHEKFSLSWSPDGGRIAFEENGEIFTVNVDGGNRTNLTNNPAFDYEPTWSPDGSHIIFASARVFYVVMHSMRSDGSDVRALPTDGEAWDMSPDVSPTGARIAFIVHSELYLPMIYTANADGTDRQVFDACGATGLCSTHRNKPKWSPDGSSIVYNIWEYFSNDSDIYVKNIQGDGAARLTNPGNNYQPTWQPLASEVSISGRVSTPDGRGLRNAVVSITDSLGVRRTATTSSFGLFAFDSVRAGEAYVIGVSSKRYRFASQTIQVNNTLTDVNFVGLE